MEELYTRLPNRLGLHLIEFDKFNHVDFLYSRNITKMVYQSVFNTLQTAESIDWVPVYDNSTSFNTFSKYNKCEDTEFGERVSRKKNNDGFWNKIMRYVKKKEVHPLTSSKEENNEESLKSRNTNQKAWTQTFYV